MTPRMELAGVVLDSPDAQGLSRFYQALLGGQIVQDEPDWVVLQVPGSRTRFSFQSEPGYVRPTWPSTPSDQQMMVHLDIRVEDLDGAGEHAVATGAALADYQPQDDVRVYLDPDGHPFCLFAPRR